MFLCVLVTFICSIQQCLLSVPSGWREVGTSTPQPPSHAAKPTTAEDCVSLLWEGHVCLLFLLCVMTYAMYACLQLTVQQ